MKRKTSYGVRLHAGGGKWDWIGSVPYDAYESKAEAYEAAQQMELDAKKARRRAKRDSGSLPATETCGEFAARWPDDYAIVKQGPTRGRPKSEKTLAIYRQELKPFIAELGHVNLRDLNRQLARPFAAKYPRSAVVVRGMLSDAVEDRLADVNAFMGLRLEESRGRRDHAPITEDELKALADMALSVHGPKFGPIYRAFILFTGYVGARLEEGLNIEWRDLRFGEQEVDLRVAKFDKPRTVLLRPEAIEALKEIPRHVDRPHVFCGKRGEALTKGNHQSLWSPIRAAWWSQIPRERQLEIVPPDSKEENYVWHSLRHFTGHWFYITLGLGSELAAFQLGHSDPSLIERLYGHPFNDALGRLKRATARPTIVPLPNETHRAAEA